MMLMTLRMCHMSASHFFEFLNYFFKLFMQRVTSVLCHMLNQYG